MNWLDLAIIAFLVILGISGAKKGLIKSVLDLAGIAVGIVLAGRYYQALATKLTFISQANIARGVAFALIIVACMVAAAIVAYILRHMIHAIMLGWADRLGGFAFGVLVAAFIAAAILTLLIKFEIFGLGPTIHRSALARFLLSSLPMALRLLPREFDSVRSFFR